MLVARALAAAKNPGHAGLEISLSQYQFKPRRVKTPTFAGQVGHSLLKICSFQQPPSPKDSGNHPDWQIWIGHTVTMSRQKVCRKPLPRNKFARNGLEMKASIMLKRF
jgi:hypothetical protein